MGPLKLRYDDSRDSGLRISQCNVEPKALTSSSNAYGEIPVVLIVGGVSSSLGLTMEFLRELDASCGRETSATS